ncbi:MAG: GH116 family glycosyl hydrolase [Terrimicrobiaceae bacterium]|nr:GH116 family glycosyl hydrolase [Terrimicrobiaceae bacterium]
MKKPDKRPQPLFPFNHPHVLQAALPLGGIGAGSICVNGHGGLQDFSIRNRPATTALPDSFGADHAAFALLHVGGDKPVTRLVEGPFPPGKIYDQGLQGQGYRHGGYEGLPRFRKSRLKSGYPFGRLELSDAAMPLTVAITAWNPFIPLDDVNSGIPCAILEYTLRNPSRHEVEFQFSYHLSHLAVGADTKEEGTRNAVIPGKGVFFFNAEAPDSETHGSASLSVIGTRPKIKAMWLRGGWFDAVSALWRECGQGKFTANNGAAEGGLAGRNGGSLLVHGVLPPGGETTIPVLITWYFPNSNLTAGEATTECCGDAQDCCKPRWRTFYASKWEDARAVALHVHRNYARLRERTVAFQRALFASTLPAAVLDAVSANLAILKSPTVLRQENGNVWGWEGCFTQEGCCSGSCTHVWNYAQSLPHLFPPLERTLREQELERSMNGQGHVNFRATLPDGEPQHTYHAAADGQLGGIMKLYRDWQISGDTPWLRRLYPLAKRSLEYCIGAWDPDRKGALVEPHHNTYDIEFWGADGMCCSVYAGALSAMSRLAEKLGEKEDAETYDELAGRAARFMADELFNGDYFEQRVQFRDLRDTSFLDVVEGSKRTGTSGELLGLLKAEGPKYQYGTGCLSDGVIGAWMARIYGIETPLDNAKVRKNLRAIHRHNFRTNLGDHANCQRPGYAMGEEPGLLLCSWPRGGKPTLPFPYSDEVWTGIEYQVASHLIVEGFVREGVQIVKAVRSRYDGAVRNPWNEYECGSYYARAMASYALLASLSGFRYSAVEKTLCFGPKLGRRPFTVFFSTAQGFGTISLAARSLTVTVVEGRLTVDRLVLVLAKKTLDLAVNKIALPGRPAVVSIKRS